MTHVEAEIVDEPRRSSDRREQERLTSAEIGAIAHLYRGEIYRSTIWRTRLDATTNWSVVSLGLALTIAFSGPDSSALPLLLVGLLILLFLFQEARRYRYFNVWRARARRMEKDFYAPLLRREAWENGQWQRALADDYKSPQHHISFNRAIGRRLRRNYFWIFMVQILAYLTKLSIHPVPIDNPVELIPRLALGPVPGPVMAGVIVVFYGGIGLVTMTVYLSDRHRLRSRRGAVTMG